MYTYTKAHKQNKKIQEARQAVARVWREIRRAIRADKVITKIIK